MIRSLVDETKDVMNPAASIDESINQDESMTSRLMYLRWIKMSLGRLHGNEIDDQIPVGRILAGVLVHHKGRIIQYKI